MPRVPETSSASQLVSYTMCPRKYWLHYSEHAPPEHKSISLVLGSAVHGAIGHHFEERLAGREPDIGTTLRVLEADLLAETVGEPVRWKEQTFDDVLVDGARLVSAYLAAHGTDPVAEVEHGFDVPLIDLGTGEVLGRPFRGYFDLVLDNGTVVELKTSSRTYSDDTVLRHLQLGAYAYARTYADESAVIRVDVMVKLKREARVVSYAYPGALMPWWISAAHEIERAIDAEVFPPSPGPLCIECEYRATCLKVGVPQARPRSLPIAPPPPPESRANCVPTSGRAEASP